MRRTIRPGGGALLWTIAAVAVWPLQAKALPELVLASQVRMAVETPIGALSIITGEGLSRTYVLGDCTLRANMAARTSRWFGSQGIYDPAPATALSPLLAKPCQGLSRTVVSEEQIHFADQASAQRWLDRYAESGTTLWSGDGLVLQWARDPARAQLSASVRQICVAARYPARLRGASDGAFKLSPLAGVTPVRLACAAVSDDVIEATRKAWDKLWAEADRMKRLVATLPTKR